MSNLFSKLKEVSIPVVVHLLSAIAFLGVCVVVVPLFGISFETMFADVGVPLPTLTQMLIDTSRWMVDYIFLVVFLFLVLFILDVVLLIKFREHSRMILKVSILSLIGGFAFVGICLYLPIFVMASGI